MTPEQETKLNEVYAFMQKLKSNNSIPKEVDSAFRKRLSGLFTLEASTKSATSENQNVNEAGSGTYAVLKSPDGFDERNDNGTIKYYPFFT